jgi:hypothetical protein
VQSVDRDQRVEVEQQDLVEPAGSAHEQHQRAHCLLVCQASLAGRVAEQVQAGDGLRERRVAEQVALVEAVMAAGIFAVAPRPAVSGPSRSRRRPPSTPRRGGRQNEDRA